jgi:5-formyltetrahydrofolate cyclo-ligase
MEISDRASKEEWRAALASTGMTRQDGNKAAEQLRRLPAYRQAKAVFAGPGTELLQIRSNVLIDGKELLMPGPALKEGFYRLRPYTVSFREVAHAVTYKGLAKYGERLDRSELGRLSLDVLLTGAVAVDGRGGRLGEGRGFFDLACAILHDSGAVAERSLILAVVAENQIVAGELPREVWDVSVEGLITPSGFREISQASRPKPKVCWEEVEFKRVRKMTPLWQLYKERRKAAGEWVDE